MRIEELLFSFFFLNDPAPTKISPLSLPDPLPTSIWIIEDHSERKRAEDALKLARNELGAIFENASVGILFTRTRIFQHCNRRAAEIFGYPTPEIGRAHV